MLAMFSEWLRNLLLCIVMPIGLCLILCAVVICYLKTVSYGKARKRRKKKKVEAEKKAEWEASKKGFTVENEKSEEANLAGGQSKISPKPSWFD